VIFLFEPGDKINHHTWGVGKILALRYAGYECFIQFDAGVVSWVKSTECVPLKSFRGTIDLPPIGQPGGKKDGSQIKEKLLSLQALEAFKLGIVPPFVKKFIFGRDRQINHFSKWFNDSKVNHSLIFGGYGTGKTHFLNYMKEMALEQNYAVAFCSVDPSEAPLYKPLFVYRKIVSSLSYSDGKNFDNFIEEIRDNRKYIDENNYVVRTLLYNSTDDEYYLRWIKGENIPKTYFGFPTLPPHTTAANIFCNLLSFYSYCFKEILGLKGLVILFDEAESLQFPSYPYQYERAINFFKGLRMTAEKDYRLLSENVTGPAPYTGSDTGLIYSGNNQIPYLYNNNTALKVAFAFTPGEVILHLCVESGYIDRITLDQLTKNDKSKAVQAIERIYSTAYETNHSKETTEIIQDHILYDYDLNIRGIVKRTIESYDVLRHYGDAEIRNQFQ
jgi:hypothetical protein